MNTKKLFLIASAIVAYFAMTLFLSIPKIAATGSPYVDPEDTSINFDMLFIVGGVVWFGGILFYTAGKIISNKYAEK
ncbi:MAG: hypothetical protein QY314_03685 [Candidatus Dojkabacteria bacterium]|nr:MAG: hypothetical protein QY314_03685 [Candidatus Dojkabacteria bacterium]